VNELTQETEQLDDQIQAIKKEIEIYKNQGLGQDNERKKLQKELEEKIKKNEEEYAQNLAEYKGTIDKINSIKNSIEEIFNLVDNDTSKKFKELSAREGLTQDNIMNYLGMVESMINDMIKQYAFYLG
jgi:chromosome segregation ATPase